MADVFLSYSRQDRKRAYQIVEALRTSGLTVWWDNDIDADAPWEKTIESELAQAGVVIVCWSKSSIESENVRAEARRARIGHRLLQVFIEQCEPPLFFGERQGFNLLAEDATSASGEINRLIDRVRESLARSTHMPALAHPPPDRVPGTRTLSRRSTISAAVAAVVIGAGSAGWVVLTRRHAVGDKTSVAVMPFANLSGDPGQAYFSDGLAEELRNTIGRLPGLKVTARTSSEKLRNDDAIDAARKLGVANILTGSVRRTDVLVRVNAQLVDGTTGLERWSQSYDRTPGDALSIQSSVAQDVAQALSIALGIRDKQSIRAGETTNVTAQDLYLKASERYSAVSAETDLSKALSLVNSAIAIDPSFAIAHVLKARILAWFGGTYAHDAGEANTQYELAANSARRAIFIAPTLISAHAVYGAILADQLKVRQALHEYQTAQSLGEDILLLRTFSIFLARLGQSKQAISFARKAAALDPLSADTLGDQAWVLFMGRQYKEAIAVGRQTLKLAPDQNQAHYIIGASFMHLGFRREAEAEISQMPPDNPTRLTVGAILASQAGNQASSDRYLNRLMQIGNDASNFQYAEIYAQRGETEKALAALDRAWTARDPGLLGLRVAAFLDPLRSAARFKALVTQLDFP